MTDALAAAEALVRSGDPRGALAQLTLAVKAAPAKPALRVFLAQLLCVLGQWERAHTQLNVAADLDASTGEMREMVGHALRCEKIRAAVFAGRRTPMIFGQPDAWLALLIESLLRSEQGDAASAARLAQQGFDDAPATPGSIDGHPFEWIADADSRLGPVLEAMVNGRYYWVPFSRLSVINFEPAVDLRDRVWLPARLTFSNGGEVVAMVPSRYPGSQDSTDGQVLLATRTEWQPLGEDRFVGMGQRVLVTDTGEYDLLGIHRIELAPAPAPEESETPAYG
jgi:type VI secretion system protein ImpE